MITRRMSIMLAVLKNRHAAEGRAGHSWFGSPEERSAVRLLAKQGLAEVLSDKNETVSAGYQKTARMRIVRARITAEGLRHA